METLERMDTAAPAAPRTDIAQAASTALDLQSLDLTKLALAGYGDWRATVAATTANLSTLALDLSTAAKCKEARSLRHRLIGEPLAQARKVNKGVKAKLNSTNRAMDAELDAIEGAYQQADTLILPKIEEREAELEAEAEARRQAELARKAKHEAGIATIRGYVALAEGKSAADMAKGITYVEGLAFGPEWEEYAEPAAAAQAEVLAKLRTMHAQAVAREAEAARQEAIRLENERVARELAEAQARINAEAAALRERAAAIEAAERRQREEAAAAEAAALDEAERQQAITEAVALVQQETEAAQASAAASVAAAATADAQECAAGMAENPGPQAEAAPHAVTAAMFLAADPGTPEAEVMTGTPADHLAQDLHRGLSDALASKPDAMLHAREAVAAIKPEPATLTLGAINGRLDANGGLVLRGAFVANVLGIQPARMERGIGYYTEAQWQAITAALLSHINAMATLYASEATTG